MDIPKLGHTIAQIEPAAIKRYLHIMNLVRTIDVSKDAAFQRLYNGYYRVRQRTPEFYKKYYSYMERNKTKGVSFEDTLLYFYHEFGKVEASFSSKLVATINPDMPIWDSIVLGHLKLSKPSYSCKGRIGKTIDTYNKICGWYQEILHCDEGKQLICAFDKVFPQTTISPVKKIDFILWQARDTG